MKEENAYDRVKSDNEQSSRWKSGAIFLSNLQIPMHHVLDLTLKINAKNIRVMNFVYIGSPYTCIHHVPKTSLRSLVHILRRRSPF